MTQTLTKINQPRPVTPLGILVEELETTLKIAQQENISSELASSLEKVYELAAGIDPYLEANSTTESPELTELAKRTAAEDWSQRFDDRETVRQLEQEMLSGHIEGQTLKMFVSMTKAKRILDIGMFTGYSALAMAEALPADGDMIACEIDEYVSEFAKQCFQNSEHGQKIKVKTAPALETLKELIANNETFDLAFIDADKPGYVDYFNLLIETNLLAKDGFICVDNTLLQGQPYLPPEKRTANGEAIAKFNQTVTEDPRVEQVILPLRDGLTIIKRK